MVLDISMLVVVLLVLLLLLFSSFRQVSVFVTIYMKLVKSNCTEASSDLMDAQENMGISQAQTRNVILLLTVTLILRK